jgi:hypothetical protein
MTTQLVVSDERKWYIYQDSIKSLKNKYISKITRN